jgi:hypothetical protein
MIYADIYDKLSSDATITAALATYEGDPAIISSPIDITDLECPYIIIEQSGGGPAVVGEPRCLRGWTENITVRIVDNREQTSGTLSDIAYAVFLALDRTNVNETNGRGYLTASGPQAYLDSDGFPGAVVQVTAHLWA